MYIVLFRFLKEFVPDMYSHKEYIFEENLAESMKKELLGTAVAVEESSQLSHRLRIPTLSLSLSLFLVRNSHISNSRSNISYNTSISDAYNSHSYANAIFSPSHCRVPRFMPVKAARCPVTHTHIRGVCFRTERFQDSDKASFFRRKTDVTGKKGNVLARVSWYETIREVKDGKICLKNLEQTHTAVYYTTIHLVSSYKRETSTFRVVSLFF